ncbi:MAG: choline/ethanolamine kinase family protein [Clostridium sp.]
MSIKKAGGLSNHNFKISFDNCNDMFIRICSQSYLNTDRQAELDIINSASKIKLTPEPYYFSIKNGNMILPWINGRLPSDSDFSDDKFMKKLTSNLKKLHNLKHYKTFNPFENIRMQINLCREKNLPLPSYFNIILQKLNSLEYILNNNKIIGLCHNDFNYSNIIISAGHLYFIDFEYSAMGDVFWDLATISWFLDTEKRKRLLNHYFGRFKEEDLKRIVNYLFVVKLSNALWSLLKSADSNSDYDYLKGSYIIFEDLIAAHISN